MKKQQGNNVLPVFQFFFNLFLSLCLTDPSLFRSLKKVEHLETVDVTKRCTNRIKYECINIIMAFYSSLLLPVNKMKWL